MKKLRELRKGHGLSMKELGNILGLSESTISLYENGKREPDIATLIKIADYFQISVDDLIGRTNSLNKSDILDKEERLAVREVHSPAMLNFEKMCFELDERTLDRIHTILSSLRRLQNNNQITADNKQYLFACLAEFIGRVELYSDNCQSTESANRIGLSEYSNRFITAEMDIIKGIVQTMSPQSVPKKREEIVIPFYLIPASAGTGCWLYDDTPADWVTVPKTDITSSADFLLEVRGDSMQPKFFDGDKVLVKKSASITEGEIGVFVLNNEAYIKKMGRGELISLNNNYNNIPLNEYDSVSCAGKVIGILTNE